MIGQAEGITYEKEQRPGNGSSREEAGVLCGWAWVCGQCRAWWNHRMSAAAERESRSVQPLIV